MYPSKVQSIQVEKANDTYGGAHTYTFQNSMGYGENGPAYDESFQSIQFVQKDLNGVMIPGVQSEQLVLALIDRHEKLNAVFPDARNARMLKGLNMFLKASKERVDERVKRGVMGDLKK